MKTLSALFFSFLIIATACNKKEIQQPVSAGDAENITIRQARNILTSHPWMYQKLVFFYHPDTNTGQVMYERGALNNTYPYDTYRFYYYKDGSYDEVDIYGNHFPGKWKILDGATLVKVTYNNNPSSMYQNVKMLNKPHYNFTYVTYTTKYAELIPAVN